MKDSLNATSLLSYGNEQMDSLRPLSSILDITQTVLHLKKPQPTHQPDDQCSFPSTPRTLKGLFSPAHKSKEYTLHTNHQQQELLSLKSENQELKLKVTHLEQTLAASDALAKQYLKDCQKLSQDLDEAKRQYAGQCHLLKDTYMEIQRLDQEVKQLGVETKQREERKDRLIEELKEQITRLQQKGVTGLGSSLIQQQNRQVQHQPYQSTLHELISKAKYMTETTTTNKQSSDKKRRPRLQSANTPQSAIQGGVDKENTMLSTLKFPTHILNETLKQPMNSYLSDEYSQRLIKSLEKKARSKLAQNNDDGSRELRVQFRELQSNRLLRIQH
ncbi:hypothetical protein FGO68_gene14647 [Halteria grandinella]|uniref:Uncharacterized protein n=1 Tax=Halteria grandinella TaxID=5974 RepID=A0A8J8T6B1_HALGN|nr:hypothetical protein FGO68_gene14647 [Halteria grandinella]